jgi:hypothetical protein
MSSPRIVSFVPSWTETLVEAGANVVGRTRFCIHAPKSIPAVGGTKDFNLERIKELEPDLFVLDREENTRPMADALEGVAPLFVSHVRNVADMPGELKALALAIQEGGGAEAVVSRLNDLAVRYEQVLALPPRSFSLPDFPGLMEWVGRKPEAHENFEHVLYAIWKDPWMAAAEETFIASMLASIGLQPSMIWPKKLGAYPQFELEKLPPRTLVLLSSEPYPFHKRKPEIPGSLVAIVDGESFSWFGIRALRFLETNAGKTD